MSHPDAVRAGLLAIVLGTLPSAALASPEETRSACLALGLTPDVFTALGVTPQQAIDSLDSVEELHADVTAWQAVESGAVELGRQLTNARYACRIAPDQATASDAEAETVRLQGELDAARAQAADLRADLITAALPAGISATLRDRVLGESGRSSGLPAAYRCADLTPDQVDRLKAALAAARRSQAHNESADSSTTQTLSQFNAIPEVATALVNQQAHLAAIEYLFLHMD